MKMEPPQHPERGDIQNQYFQDNLKELLGLSERLSQNSAETAKQAGQGIGGPDRT
jgi:hypothetical protein